ncbi:MFS transporter [Nitrospirillum bahiense]|uniref:Putative MFS family arabinose efflux permease n=1 Tax=Nitrospirillum amazonense TaxID=28077 RepID=A0A560F6V1_9PROT|nr:MFS transporter [Nitrospirillum amazonense]TWB17349.1 putative MFS family arabinose efflux permease [Nitrospirillum amazonense]
MDSRWVKIIWFYCVGVIAAAQLGKMSALIPLISRDLGLSLTLAALVISLLEIGGAGFGRIAGGLIQRAGRRPALLAGTAFLTVGGIGESLAPGPAALIAWRVLESAGYLTTVIAAPMLILETATPRQRGVALALWSSFVPVGLALGAILSGWAAELWSWRGALFGGGVVAAGALALSLPMTSGVGARVRGAGAGGTGPTRRAWALAVGFGCYTTFEVGLLGMLPTFLVDKAGASADAAGFITGVASFATVAGSVVAGWWNHRNHGRDLARGPSFALMALSIVLPALLLFLVFGPAPDLTTAAIVVIALNALSGVYPGLAFAMLPAVAGSDRGLPAANGLLTQFGASGSLIGPPLFAAFAGHWGWTSAAACGLAASLLCLALMRAAGVSSSSSVEASDAPVTDH